MIPTRHNSPPPPALHSSVVRGTAARGAWWVLVAPALALAATLVLAIAGARGDWIGAVWLIAVLWTIAANLVQALWAGFRHGDWSTFSCEALPRCEAFARDDDHDFATRTGTYAHLRIRAEHEASMRDGERFLKDHDHSVSLG